MTKKRTWFLIAGIVFLAQGVWADQVLIYEPRTGQTESVERVMKTRQEWKKLLGSLEYRVLRQKGTERAFTGDYLKHKEKGIFRCRACGTALFDSQTKYNSRTGWPSFWDVVSPVNVRLESDKSFGLERTEVLCARCDSHLGHLFDDGPKPTRQRYCINSAALQFSPK